jgi:hypothetical protein
MENPSVGVCALAVVEISIIKLTPTIDTMRDFVLISIVFGDAIL